MGTKKNSTSAYFRKSANFQVSFNIHLVYPIIYRRSGWVLRHARCAGSIDEGLLIWLHNLNKRKYNFFFANARCQRIFVPSGTLALDSCLDWIGPAGTVFIYGDRMIEPPGDIRFKLLTWTMGHLSEKMCPDPKFHKLVSISLLPSR